MKKIISFLFVLLFILSIGSAQNQKYSRVKVYADEAGIMKISSLGIPVEGEVKKGHYLISDFSGDEIKLMKDNGFQCEIVIDDVKSYYKTRSSSGSQKSAKSLTCGGEYGAYQTPVNFAKGSMGGFYTFTEMLTELDNMVALFPTLITVKQPATATNTIGGRQIWWVKISDNPNLSEAEPKVLYTALTHAREPQSMQQLIFYMYYLLENYGTNTEITDLVNNTEMFFIPCVNPDGYVYNQTTDPDGGGMWRKNRRNNGGGIYGVDLNRNFGYEWAHDNSGSSPNSWDETYRGTSAFSEAENQNVRDFCNAHEVKITMNYHAYGNYLINPWGYEASLLTPDSVVYTKYGQLLTKENNYASGTCNQTLAYITNGDAVDWMYGEQSSKEKIFAFTAEIGDDGFWPDTSNILPYCKINMYQNLLAAKLVGKYAVATDASPSFLEHQTGFLKFDIQRLGLDSPATYTVSVIPLLNITSVGAPKTYNGMSILETRSDSISYILDPGVLSGQYVKYILNVSNGFYSITDTIVKIYGEPLQLLGDNCSNISNWTSSDWGITSEAFVSSPTSITDSPYANYSDNTYASSIVLNNNFDLTHALAAVVNFNARWRVEASYDYVQIKASTNNGSTWTPLCGKFTHAGGYSQAYGEPVYDAFQDSWVKEEINLKDYLGFNVKLLFELNSDNGNNYEGFYFDDLKVLAIPDSGTSIINIDQAGMLYLSDPIPNPASQSFSVNISCPVNSGGASFCIYNTNGQEVLKKQLNTLQNRINVSTDYWKKGVYYYYLRTEKNISVVKKVIIY